MKNQLLSLLAILLSSVTFAQTPLPTGWNFDDPTPLGWTESLDNNPGLTRYTQFSVSGSACKLDGDDEFVVVHYGDVCGSVNYYLGGSGSQPSNDDIFTIQESVDGSTWTTLRQLVGSDLNGGYTDYTDNPNADSRYIRWYFTEKQTGRNVGLDEITLQSQVPTDNQEISLSINGVSTVSNTTFFIGNTTISEITVYNENLPTGSALNISDVTITGQNAADFSLQNLSLPTSVGAADSLDFQIEFSPGGMGERYATLTIVNDDFNGNETNYVIDLAGIGGDFAIEPTEQPTNLSFDNVTSYTYDVSFDDASVVPDNYVVLRSIGLPIPAADNPVDGNTYVKGDYINGTQVVYVGPAGSFRPKYVVADTDYYFAAYAFNGIAGFENYLTDAPLTANVTSGGSMVGNYFTSVDPSASTFLTDLQDRLNQGYNQVFYSNYIPIMLNKFASRDTTGGWSVITDVYSGYRYLYSGPFAFDVLSREHSWPHSWMPGYPDNEDDQEYSDLHNLFPVHQNSVNAVRSNYPLGEVVNEITSFQEGKYGTDVNGDVVYEPRDQHKGDAARAIFYMGVKYDGTGGSWKLPNPIDPQNIQYGQNQDVLKQWHWQDPPDAWEIARNDFVESEQGNRNPFVDSVNWVCYIDFETMTYIGEQTTPCTVTPEGIEEQLKGEFSISPNPTDGEAVLNMKLNEAQELTINVLDITGRTVSTRTKNFNTGMSREMFDMTNLDAGIYNVILQGENGRTTLKVVLQ